MDFFSTIDWAFLEEFFGAHGKVIAAVLALFVGVISLFIAILKHWHAQATERTLDRLTRDLEKKNNNLEKKDEALRQAADRLKEQEAAIKQREKRLNDVRAGFKGKEHDLWCMHAPRLPENYDSRIRGQRRKPIIMLANLKGGVGKTTLAANLAAHFSATGKRVLLVDVDYQGSLSNMLLSADGDQDVPLGINNLLTPGTGASRFPTAVRHFSNVLRGSSIVPARYELASLENRLLIEALLQDDEDDGRYRLADVLLADEVAKTFDIALIDAPPRLTAGAVNAFCASTHLLVPTVYDILSAEAVGTFLNGVQVMKGSLNHRIDLLGVVGMLTMQQGNLSDREENAKRVAMQQVSQAWGANYHFFDRHIPRKAAIAAAAGEAIAYFRDPTVRGWFDELGAEIAERLGWETRRTGDAEQVGARRMPERVSLARAVSQEQPAANQ
jgi:chromosome partitioning protein